MSFCPSSVPIPLAALTDIKTLAEGFSELLAAKAVAAEPPAPDPAPVPERLFYTTDDTNVRPPRALSQTIPRPPVLASRSVAFTGTLSLELTISPEGLVENVVITEALNPIYDAMLVEAAKRWRYEPAVLDGTAVRFRKKSESAWKLGFPMWYDSRNAECRGSIVHLEPVTE